VAFEIDAPAQPHMTPSPSSSKPANIIVFGNEKGGSGKSTTAMHTAIGLLRLGYTVATIDLDARQGTLTRYMANRFDFTAATRTEMPAPVHLPIEKSKANLLTEQEKEVLSSSIRREPICICRVSPIPTRMFWSRR
jgi:chromosome partitioning protein